jgi:RNA ligase (TIGR02306 family)
MEGNLRKLASIQKIDEIKPHTNADSLELAKVGGWQIVVKRGQFKSGDLCVYAEIDCLMPEKPEFEFLRSKHFRIKTMKLRGELSQGIAFPLDILGEYISTSGKIIGADVTEILGIKKYEAPISPQLSGIAKGNFPTHIIPKTDEERLQSKMSLLDEMKDKVCYITLKEDGTSFTAYHIVEPDMTPEIMSLVQRVGVCSRNLELKSEDTSLYTKIAKQYDVEEKLNKFYQDEGRNIAVQGEITGDGIAKNPLGLQRNKNQLHLFNIYDIDKHKYVDYAEFIMIASVLEIPTVETIFFGRFNFTLEQLLEKARGKYSGTKNNFEGIVIRPVEETFSEKLQGRLSFKVINNDYLLKEE